MDTVYGTKKYFQSLSGVGSDIYRTSTCRAVTNDYSSYQNTLGRRSVLASYSHMPTTKHPSYLTDFSLSSSQYGYNTWGVWRDTRNLSPSTYSSKSRQSVKSFSIILTTAAFIVVLAVLSIGGLAFYFSTFKTNNEDSVMAFQGSFRVSKGDIYTTGLKYNHTSTYKQKVDFYKRFIERSLMDNSLQPVKTDVMDFGDGPLINIAFRVFLDMRTLPRNIQSMEEHIRESILLETTSLKSLYKSLKIEPESIIIKRIMDEELVKSASFAKDTTPSQSQTHFEKRLTKKNGSVEKTIPKMSSTPKSKIRPNDDEPDIDVENAPVIQGSFEGSFEITKTDADITRKRTTPTKSVSTSATPFTTKFKSKKPTIEKVIPFMHKTFESAPTTTTASFTTLSMQTTTPTTSTTTTTTTTTESLPEISISSSSIISSSTENAHPPIPSTSFYPPPLHESFLQLSNVHNPPKLDTNLFTNPPVMDTEPWRPIRPESMIPPQVNMKQPSFGVSPTLLDAFETGLLPRNKFKITDHITKNPNEMMFYHSFTNPVFMPGTSGIEKLGSADVKPHPLPVPLIDEAMIPPFKPLNPTIHSETQQPINISSDIGEKFEHIGGGVIVKKHEETTVMPTINTTNAVQIKFTAIKHVTNTTDATTPSTLFEKSTQPIISEITTKISQAFSSTELGEILDNKTDNDTEEFSMTDKLANFLLELLEVPKEKNNTQNSKVESRIESEEKEKPNFLNIKEIVLNRNKNSNTTKDDEKNQNLVRSSTGTSKPTTASTIPITTKFSEKPTTTVRTTITRRKGSTKPKPKPTTFILDSTRTTPLTLDDSLLFPSHSKWEYVNGSSSGFISTTPMKKTFNETLQAWIVENDEKRENHTIKDIPVKRNHTFELQNISMIFDTLVSKLGISPTMPTKIPPFAAFSQNKLKIRNKTKNQTATVRTTTVRTTRPSSTSTTTTTTTTTTTNTPIISSSTGSLMDQQFIENMSPEIIIGEAEVEVVDPTKYEEMLSSSVSLQSSTISKTSTSTTTIHPPTLVTLMPVRSNSGIRTFRPPPIKSRSGSNNESSGTNSNSGSSESRRFVYHPKYRETVVKTGIQVTS